MQSYLSEDASSDASLGPAASIAEFRIRSVMCVPLATADGQADRRHPARHPGPRPRSSVTDDLNLLTIVANLAGVAIEKARMHETVLTREKEQKEIELARKVQLGFLPQTLPEVAGYEFYSHYSARPRPSAATTTTSSRCPAAASRSCSATWPARACPRRCWWPS